MPYKVEWLDVNVSVIAHFQGYWTWDEVERATDEINAHLTVADHEIHVVLDMTESKGVPEGFMRRLPGIVKKTDVNRGVIVMSGAKPIVVTLNNAYMKLRRSNIVRAQFLMTRTVEEARGRLAEVASARAQAAAERERVQDQRPS